MRSNASFPKPREKETKNGEKTKTAKQNKSTTWTIANEKGKNQSTKHSCKQNKWENEILCKCDHRSRSLIDSIERNNTRHVYSPNSSTMFARAESFSSLYPLVSMLLHSNHKSKNGRKQANVKTTQFKKTNKSEQKHVQTI